MRKFKIFVCPECQRGRKFATLHALNIHIGKNHSVNYRIMLIDNKPFIKRKENFRGKPQLIKNVTPPNTRHD